MGRTHRASQHSAPSYLLVTSDLAAEARFAATVAKRAKQLGAATSGDRRGTQGSSLGSDLLVGPHAPAGARLVQSSLECGDVPRWFPVGDDWEAERSPLARTFERLKIPQNREIKSTQLLGRLLGVAIEESNSLVRFYEAACEQAAAADERARARRDEPVQDLTMGSRVTRERTHEETGILELNIDTGVDFDEALRRKSKAEGAGAECFFVFRDDVNKLRGLRRFHALVTQSDSHRVAMLRPSGGTSSHAVRELLLSYAKFDDAENIRDAWDAEHALVANECTHGCPPSHKCTTGTRMNTKFIVRMPGALRLISNLGKCCASLVRVKDTDERFVGALFEGNRARQVMNICDARAGA